MPRLRVLLLLHELSLTGAPRLSLDVFKALDADIELRTIALDGGPLEPEARALGELAVLRTGALTRLPTRRPAGRYRTAALGELTGRAKAPFVAGSIRRWRPDLVYVSSVEGLRVWQLLRLKGYPTLLHVHEGPIALREFDAAHPGLMARVPKCYVAVSASVATAISEGWGIPTDRIAVVRPWVDEDRIHAASAGVANVEAGHRTRPYVVGGAGNPTWTKGVELWLLMARTLCDSLGDGAVRFVWVGVRANDAARRFHAMVDKLGLTSAVDLVDVTENPYPRFATFDVFAMTSWEEAASLVVLENMALGVPVVCFAGSGGPPEAVDGAGIVVDAFSPLSMAEAIADLLRSDERREALGSAGKARIEAEFSAASQAPRLKEQILAAATSARPSQS
jgi:glycosyltransferase involved in cell wall biosynthesis